MSAETPSVDDAGIGDAVVGDDGIARCPWGASGVMREYHDLEWGRPAHGERALFERISLEGFQSGLSWLIVLRRRPALRAAFDDFDPDAVAAYTDAQLEERLADPAIIRNRAKVLAVRSNALATVALRATGGLERLVESHRPPPAPAPVRMSDLTATSPASIALADDLKRAGFRFVGPTTVHALIQAIGLIDDHLAGCHRRGGSSSRGAELR